MSRHRRLHFRRPRLAALEAVNVLQESGRIHVHGSLIYVTLSLICLVAAGGCAVQGQTSGSQVSVADLNGDRGIEAGAETTNFAGEQLAGKDTSRWWKSMGGPAPVPAIAPAPKSWSQKVKAAFVGAGEALRPKPRTVKQPDALSLANGVPKPTAESHTTLARVQEASGHPEMALASFHAALELSPKDYGALLGLAHFHDRQGELDEAAKVYQRLLQHHPKAPQAHNDAALCHARRGDLAAARQSLERAISLAPEHPLYRNNLAVVLLEAGQLAEALQHQIAAHGAARGHYNVGYMLQQKSRPHEARQFFATALQHDPSLQQARDWLVKLSPAGGPQTAGHAVVGRTSGPGIGQNAAPGLRQARRLPLP